MRVLLKEEIDFKMMVAAILERCEDEYDIRDIEEELIDIIGSEAERRYYEVDDEDEEDWEDEE